MKIISGCVFSILSVLCNRNTSNQNEHFTNPPGSCRCEIIGEIPVPAGYTRVAEERKSFGDWLRTIHLKKDPRIYLFNGRLRDDQSTHFAVLDIPVGDKDLQQCADKIMRLRAEYFFNQDNIDSICFTATDGTRLSFARWMKGDRYRLTGARLAVYNSGIIGGDKRQQLEEYLEVVFSYCGTISLNKETRAVNDLNNLKTGDIS